jgi:hypothetical protein
MTDTDPTISRRRLLAAGGAATVGFLGIGAASALTAPVAYRRSTVVPAQAGPGPGVSLRVDWTEWYNGEAIERQPGGDGGGESQPSIALGNVLPGDAGRVALGVRIADGDSTGTDVRMRLRELPSSGSENGRNDPEQEAGDDTPRTGELGDHLDVRLWRDSGIQVADTVAFGSCDGQFNAGDRPLEEGTFSEVAVASGSDAWLDVTGEEECLGSNEKLCVGFEWTVGSSNLVQSDGVAFAIEFGGRQCGE